MHKTSYNYVNNTHWNGRYSFIIKTNIEPCYTMYSVFDNNNKKAGNEIQYYPC